MTHDFDPQEREIKLANLKLVTGLWPFIKPRAWMLGICCGLLLIVTVFDILVPWFTRMAIDGFILPVADQKGTQILGLVIHEFSTFALLFFLVFCASFIIDFFQSAFMEYTGQKIILDLRCRLFSHMMQLPVPFFDKNASGRMVSRVAGDVENMNDMFSTILVFLFRDLMLMTGILVAMVLMNPRLALYTSLIIPLIIVSIAISSVFIRRAFRIIRQKIAEINHIFSESLTGIKIIQTTVSHLFFTQRFNRLNREHFDASMFQIRIFAIFMPFISFLGMLSSAIIIYIGSMAVTRNTLSIGELVAFLFYMKLFFRPLRELSEKFSMLQNALASGERIITILNRQIGSHPPTGSNTLTGPIQTIEFENISFSYKSNQPVLCDINITLEKGQSIGIVGHTGSGKTSIINLLAGFYSPDSGHIKINGIDHSTLKIEEIRKRTALVMQDPFLFSGSVKENIQPWETVLSDDILEKALKNANCDFLFSRHQGLDTEIKEGGNPFSSGEKQLVCIARAFATDPDLIIFDEATSYMDSQSEQKIHEAVHRLMIQRTSIIIAHRLSTVRNCNTIYLLRNGRIKEYGNHQELVARKGEYFHLLEKEKIYGAGI